MRLYGVRNSNHVTITSCARICLSTELDNQNDNLVCTIDFRYVI